MGWRLRLRGLRWAGGGRGGGGRGRGGGGGGILFKANAVNEEGSESERDGATLVSLVWCRTGGGEFVDKQ